MKSIKSSSKIKAQAQQTAKENIVIAASSFLGVLVIPDLA
jgi:hypothetical protein